MIRNGPNTRLKRAPGRRTTSITSFVTNEVVRVQLLSSPSNVPLLSLDHELGENLVEVGEVLAAAHDMPTRGLDLLEHSGRGSPGIFGHQHQVARGRLLDSPHTGYALQHGA